VTRRIDLTALARQAREEGLQEELAAVLREFRRPGCAGTRMAMAGSIVDLRRSLRELQGELLALRAQQQVQVPTK
jgi:hypothetical protein